MAMIESARADLLATSGRAAEAIKHSQNALNQDPTSPEGAALHGALLYHNGDSQKAEPHLKQADQGFQEMIRTDKANGKSTESAEKKRADNLVLLAETMVRNGNPEVENVIGQIPDLKDKQYIRNLQSRMNERAE